MTSVRRLAVCLVCCAAGLVGSPVAALGEGKASEGSPLGEGSGVSLLEGSLVVPGVQTLEAGQPMPGGEEVKGSSPEETKGSSPEAVSVPEEPRTKVGEGSASGEGSAVPSPFEGPLVVPGALGSEEALRVQAAEEARAAEEAKRNSPEAVSLREESRTKFENLNTEQAGKVSSF